MLRRAFLAAMKRIGRKDLEPAQDLTVLVSAFTRQLSLAGCVGRCHVVFAGAGPVVMVTLARTKSYNLKLLSIIAQVAIEKLREEFKTDIKAVYWCHEPCHAGERMTSPGLSVPRVDDSWSDHRGHRMDVKEIDLEEFESALQANQGQVLPETLVAS